MFWRYQRRSKVRAAGIGRSGARSVADKHQEANTEIGGYESIDALLAAWARTHGAVWHAEYEDEEDRVFEVGSSSRDWLQIWIDPARDGQTTVHLFQSKRGLLPMRGKDFPCLISELPQTLDNVLELAVRWHAGKDLPSWSSIRGNNRVGEILRIGFVVILAGLISTCSRIMFEI